jgi:hypothetical protein
MNRLHLALIILLLTSCSTQMDSAKQQIDAAQSAVDTSTADASKYMPEHSKTLERRMGQLKAAFNQKDYQTVLADGPRLIDDARTLQQQVATKKAESQYQLGLQWTQLSSGVPQMLETIKARIGVLQASKRVPNGVDLAAGQVAMNDASMLWDKARTTQASGDLTTAVAAVKSAQSRAQAAADALKLKLPTGTTATPAAQH